MATSREIRNHIESIQETQKITGAMYLIASTKMRKAKNELDKTRPFFEAVKGEIKRILRTVGKINSPYFYPSSGEHELPGDYGYLVITADKGLAGAYNQNIIKETLRMISLHRGAKLFVVGEYGRQYFEKHHIPVEEHFSYSAQNPTLHRAREICEILLDHYDRRSISKLFVIFTDFQNSLQSTVTSMRLLPFHNAHFGVPAGEAEPERPIRFLPSVSSVLKNILPCYLMGLIYSALVDSFCSEQSARMSAMDQAGQNAERLLSELKQEYNHVRQGTITQEITEIVAGARGQQRKLKKQAEEYKE